MKIEVTITITKVETMYQVKTLLKLLLKFIKDFPISDEHIMIDPAGFTKVIKKGYGELEFDAHQIVDDNQDDEPFGKPMFP